MFLKRWAEKWCKRQDEQDAKTEAYERLKRANALATRLKAEAEKECRDANNGGLVEDDVANVLLIKRKRSRATTGLNVGDMSAELDPRPISYKNPTDGG